MASKPSDRISNEQLRRDNIAALEQYLTSVDFIPEGRKRGEVNLSAIALAAGVRRAWLYDDVPNAMIQQAAKAKGLGLPRQQHASGGDQLPGWAAQRIKALEEQIAVAKAEARDLRERLRRYEHLERHMTETGRLAR